MTYQEFVIKVDNARMQLTEGAITEELIIF